MRRRFDLKTWLGLSLLILAAGARNGLAQTRYMPRYQEPRWFTFRLSQVAVGAYAEADYQKSTFQDTDDEVSYTRTFVGPALALNGTGSIYHPNLITYTLTTDGAIGWAHDRVESSTTVSSSDEVQYLGAGGLNVDFLPGRPYNAGAFFNYNNTWQDYDFFSRVMMESYRYGGRASWQHEPWFISTSYAHRDEESSSRYPVPIINPITGLPEENTTTQATTTKEDNFNFGVRHRRLGGETAADYNYNRYNRTDFGQVGVGEDHSISASDSERFGAHDQYSLTTSASYALRNSNVDESEEFLANGVFNAQHRPNLSSAYEVAYDHFKQEDYTSDAINGQASLTHQFYQSLTSSLFVRASDYEQSADSSEGYTRRYGAGFSENYTKLLTDEHRLRLGASLFVEHTDQELLGTIVNERHNILPAGEPGAPSPFSFILAQPNVNPLSIVITDLRDAPPYYVPGFDYEISVLGSRTVITWLRPPGPGTPTVVLVDYDSEPLPPGSYETLSQSYYVRFELWKNLLGLYSRVSLSQNNAPDEMRVQEFVNYAVGTDFTYRGFRAGAEYQVYDSTDSDYRSVRLFQSYGFRPDEFSTLTFDLNEMWIDYTDSGTQEQDYRFITRYYRAMARHLGLNIEAGVSYRDSDDTDQLLAAFRPSIRYTIGRTTIDAGYWYQYELFLNEEERQKHMLSIRLKRLL